MKFYQTDHKYPWLHQLLLVMKVTTAFILLFSLHLSARTFSQEKISLSLQKTELSGILSNIEKQTTYRFLYNNDLPALRQKASITVKQSDLVTVLDNLLQNTGLTYRLMDKDLVVIKEINALMPPEKKTITGKVSGDDGNPLSGVSVQIKGATAGVVTNDAGIFSINVPDDNRVLVFSYIGYESKEVSVKGKTSINVSLLSLKKALDEVVVVGYGTVRKKDLTGSVISVKAEEIRKVPASNVMEALQGKLSGVDIVRTSGGAGATSSVTIRGNRSIIANNSPLYIVDGIQYENYQDINSNDIQSMDVLKDASSTAIYGSRGANGVVIITTRKGMAGKLKVSANTYFGVSDIAGYPVPMNGTQFADLKRQAYRTNGKWNSTADDATIFTSSELAGITNGVSTYWPGLILNKGNQQDYGVGVAGGNDKTKVYFSFDYLKEAGLLKNDYSNRYTLRLNIDQTISNSFKVGLQSQLTYYKQNSRAEGVLTVSNKLKPLYLPYSASGAIISLPGSDNQTNPLLDDTANAYLNLTKTTRIFSTAYAEWKPVSGLTIRSNLGITNSSSQIGFFESSNTLDRNGSGSLAKITNGTTANLIWENIITYQKKWASHTIELTGITSYISNRNDSSSAQGTGQLIPGQIYYALQNNPSNIVTYSNYVGSNTMSFAYRANYNYKGRYLLSVTGRSDASSVLAKQNRWSFFPSVAGAWRLIDENFMTNQHLFQDLKLRASYGISGNASVKPYQTQSGLILIPSEWNDVSVLSYGLNPQTGNPNLKWELTATTDVGVDFSMFKNRVKASVDYYDSKTHDLLLLMQLPPTSGVQSILQNIGKTRNKGIEISIQTENIHTRNFSWTSSITYTRNQERITALPNNQNDIANGLFIGYPVKSFYDYQKIGIWQSADSVLAKSYGYKPGDIRVMDKLSKGRFSADTDRVVLGNPVPKYSFGFGNDFKFKNFDFSVYVFARIGQMFVSSYANKFEPNAIENGAVVNYWTPENPTNDYPRPNSTISRAALPFATTLGFKDGSFVKIRNITLGYTLPESVAKKLHIAGLRWYVSAKNYITFSKIKDYDPEGGGSFETPLTKLIVTGLNLDF